MAHNEAGAIAAAAVFLAGYSIYFTILTTLFAKRRIKWKSRYLLVYFHVTLRLVGESYTSLQPYPRVERSPHFFGVNLITSLRRHGPRSRFLRFDVG